ncbi:MAG TPA: methyl-accepting chemotaxis protein, partial [Dissulfurispiraceae bacterium]
KVLSPYFENHPGASAGAAGKDNRLEGLLAGLDSCKESLSTLVQTIREKLHDIEGREEGLFDMLKEVTASAETQLMQLGATTSEVKQFAQTIDVISGDSGELAEYSGVVSGAAVSGNDTIEKVQSEMNSVYERVNESTRKIQSLGKSSENIGEIISVISTIAEQTNLLALNAAIEAARAGEQGRGFAVVADEVRKLAERTSSATKEISTMVRTIQGEVVEVVNSIEQIVHGVESGKDLSMKAGEAFRQVNNGVSEMNGRITSIASSTNQQLASSKEISSKMDIILAESRKIAIGIETTWDTMGDLIESIKRLEQHGGNGNNH